MTRKGSSLPGAIVLGLNPNALGIVRSLAPLGIDLIAVERKPRGPDETHLWMSTRTRLCRKVLLDSRATADDFIDWLLSREQEAERPALILSADDQVLALNRRRDQLAHRYAFQLPEPATLDLFMDKIRFYGWAADHGFPVPASVHGPQTYILKEASERLRFPVVVKPEIRDADWDRTFGSRKALIAESPSKLAEMLAEAAGIHANLVVQEQIPGPDSELFFSHVYVDRTGQIRALWTGRKLRQHPIHFGTSTFTETVPCPQVADISRELIEMTGARGYLSVEAKRDSRDGVYRIMEVTAGRTWYPHFLGTVAGANIPEIWYRDVTGQDLPKVGPSVRYGVRWVDEYRDLVAAQDYRKVDSLRLVDWLRSYQGTRAFALTSVQDPLPILFVAMRICLAFMRRLQRLFGFKGSDSKNGRRVENAEA